MTEARDLQCPFRSVIDCVGADWGRDGIGGRGGLTFVVVLGLNALASPLPSDSSFRAASAVSPPTATASDGEPSKAGLRPVGSPIRG